MSIEGSKEEPALGSDVGPVCNRPCVHPDGARNETNEGDREGRQGLPEEAEESGTPKTRGQIVAASRNASDSSRQGITRRASVAPAAAATPSQRRGGGLPANCADHVTTDDRQRGVRMETERAAALRDRQLKTEKFTSSSTGAVAMQRIRGRSISPGLSGERGQDVHACESVASASAPTGDCAIRGRTIALGAARAVREAEVGGGRTSGCQATSQTEDDSGHMGPHKRRRVSAEAVHSSPGQQVGEAARLRPGAAGTFCWSSRKDLLESLRSGVRPPESPS